MDHRSGDQAVVDRGSDVQLALLETPEPVWRLDDHTREVGRQGVAAARAVLRRSLASSGGGRESQAA